MGFPINPPNAPIVTADGRVTPEWWKFFLAIQKMIGGSSDPFQDSILMAGSGSSVAGSQGDDLTALLLAPQAEPTRDYYAFADQPGTLTAGAGLTGGGNMGGNISVAIGAGTGITVGADDVALDTGSTRNIDHTAVSINAGTGLSGGGDISATRTINLANTAVTPGTYAPPTSITVDAQGRITAIT